MATAKNKCLVLIHVKSPDVTGMIRMRDSILLSLDDFPALGWGFFLSDALPARESRLY